MRQGRLVEGRVVSGSSEKAVAAPQKKKQPFRNHYYCPLEECYEKPPKEKISGFVIIAMLLLCEDNCICHLVYPI